MGREIKKICQICEKPFKARRDAKTCSPTCRKRLQRSLAFRIAEEARHIEVAAGTGLQQLADQLFPQPQSLAYSPAEMTYEMSPNASQGSPLSRSVGVNWQESEPESIKVVQASNPASAATSSQLSSASVPGPGSVVEPTSSDSSLFAANITTPDDKDVVTKASKSAKAKPNKPSNHSSWKSRILEGIALVIIILLLGAGLLVSLGWGRSNHNRLGQLNDAQRQQSQQQLKVTNSLTIRTTNLESKVAALTDKVNGLKVGTTTIINNNGGGLPALDGSSLSNVNATTLGGNYPSYYTNASNLASGTIGAARLPANVAFLDANNVFSAVNVFQSSVVVQGSAGLTIGVPGSLSGSIYFANAISNKQVVLQGLNPGGSGNATIQIPSIAGGTTDTVCLASLANCGTGGSAVTSLDGQTGALTLANSTGTAGTITISNAKADASTKGLASFNATNFTDNGSGIINTVQNIATTSSPTFSALTLNSPLTVPNGGTGTNSLALNGLLYGNGTSAIQATGAAANSILATNGSSVPGLTQTLPMGVQANITGTGALTTGSIGSGFGNVNIGSNTFTGNGSGLTSLNGSNISSGTVSDARLTSNVTLQGNAFNGNSELVQLTGGGLLPVLDGSNLTNLNATNIASGTVANARLTGSGTLTVTAGTGLSGGGSVALGSSTTLSTVYGSSANTAVQGNTSLTCASGTGNLSGGGNGVTLGAGGSCNNLTITNSPTFSGVLAVQGAGGITVGSTTNTGTLQLLDGTNDGFNASLGLSGVLGANQAFVLPASGGTLCTTTTCAAGSGSGYVQLQGATPGTAQTGNLNITGTGIVGALNVTNAATVGSGLTVTTGGLAVTGNSTITGTLGSLTGLTSSGTITFSGLGTGVLQAASGVLSTGAVALGTQTTGSYVANLGTLTGLTTSGNSGAGSTPTLSVTYGSGANTAVQGNVTLNCPTISGTNLTGGGGAITLGSGGSCSSIGFTNSPTFSGTLAVQGSNALTLGNTGSTTGAILFNGATAASGTLTVIGPANPSTNTLTLPNETGTLCSTGSVCSGYAPASGSGNYIRNGTAQQTANFNIASSAIGNVGAIIQGASGQTADLLDVKDGSGNTVASVGNTGNTLIKPSTTSTTAFAVQNTSNAAALNVDTTNMTTTLRAGTDNPTLGTENITTQPDGTWSGTPTNWTTSAGAATHATGNTTALSTSQFTPVNGTQYQVSYTFSGTPNTGTVTVTMGGVTVATYNFSGLVSQEQNFTDTRVITATSGAVLTFTPSSGFIGTVSAISVKTIVGTSPTLVVNNATANNPNIQVTASSNTSNTFIGLSAASFNSTGINNVALGTNALQSNTTGHDNMAVGFNTLHLNTVGFSNSAFGSNALAANIIAIANTAIGTNTLTANTVGSFGTAVGFDALQTNTTGQLNTAIGANVLQSNSSGGSNTGVGENALKSVVSGGSNTAIGTGAGVTNTGANALTTGAGNTFLGAFSGSSQNAYQVANSTVIGFDATTNQSNAVILGCTNSVNSCAATSTVGIGSQYAPSPLTVNPNTYGLNGTAGVATSIAQTTTAITGTSTTFTSSMTGGTIYYNDGTTATVTFVDSTHLTSSVSKTVTGPANYTIAYGGFNVKPAGTTYLQPTSDSTSAFQIQNAAGTALLTADTSNMVITVSGTSTTFGSLTLTNAHFKSTQTTAPTIGTPTNCGGGTGPTAAVTAASTDSAGSFTITAGSTGSPTTCDTIITFNKTYGAAPKSIVLTSTSATGGDKNIYISASSATTFTVKFGTNEVVPANSEADTFNYWVIE